MNLNYLTSFNFPMLLWCMCLLFKPWWQWPGCLQ